MHALSQMNRLRDRVMSQETPSPHPRDSRAPASIREIAIAVDATGIRPREGHRIVELGMVECVDGALTGRTLHVYLNPDRPIDEGAAAVHGLSLAMLDGAPRFAEVAPQIVAFLAGARPIVVRASFTLGFLNAEFQRLEWPSLKKWTLPSIATWPRAKKCWPKLKNDLDRVSARLGIVVSDRDALMCAMQIARTHYALLSVEAERESNESGRV